MQAVADWFGGMLLLGAFVFGWIVMGRVIVAAVAGASGFLPM
jgi:hypothetical protein